MTKTEPATERPPNEKYTPGQIIEALRATKGLVYRAASALGCSANTVYRYARTYPEVQEAIDEERGKLVDTAEAKLADAIDRGDAWAIALALKTIGKGRGYVERTEHEHHGALPVESIEELRDRARRMGIPEIPTGDLEQQP